MGVYRHGKYIDRINKGDYRYNIVNLRVIPKISYPRFGWLQKVYRFSIRDGYDIKTITIVEYWKPQTNTHGLSQTIVLKNYFELPREREMSEYIFKEDGSCENITLINVE